MARTRLAAKALQAAKAAPALVATPTTAATTAGSAGSAVSAIPASSKESKPVTKRAKPATPATPSTPATPPTQLFEDAIAWETWLETNHSDTAGLWLKMSKKASGIASVTYDEALDSALCWGWIDGQRKTHDENHYVQRFTPRRKNSMWSQRNVAKVAVLIDAGRMRLPGHAEIDAAKADGRWARAYSSSSAIEVPPDFQAALDASTRAQTFFDGLGKTKRYAFLWRITTAKRDETRKKKIAQFVQLLAEGKTL